MYTLKYRIWLSKTLKQLILNIKKKWHIKYYKQSFTQYNYN